MNKFKVMCLGDVVGSIGRRTISENLKLLKDLHHIDFTIVNCENACGGVGLDIKRAYELRDCGIDVITLGDHTWSKKDLLELFNDGADWIIRPANYMEGAPGKGFTTVRSQSGISVSVANLLGRVFIENLLDCPFAKASKILGSFPVESKIRIFDFHAEATSEKIAFGKYVDGKASLVFGTHTHVQTADEVILNSGTGYITDLGMCGSQSGVIGMSFEAAIYRFTTGRPKFYEGAEGQGVLHGVICEIDSDTGRAISINRLRYPEQL